MTDQQQAAEREAEAEALRRWPSPNRHERGYTYEETSAAHAYYAFIAGAAWQREQTPDIKSIQQVLRHAYEQWLDGGCTGPVFVHQARAVRDLLGGEGR